MRDGKFVSAIIGFGGQGNWQHEVMKRNPDIIVKGVYDIREVRMEFAKEKGLYTYSSPEEIYGDGEVDLVVVATPNDVHKSYALALCEAGKNVVCEKPVTLSTEDLKEMVDAANKNGVLLTSYQNRRWDKDYLIMKEIVESGDIGEVYNIESRVQGSRGIPGDWRKTKEHGGGMVYDWGIHLLDQILMMSDDKVKKVYGELEFVTKAEVDDGFRTVLTMESGRRVMVEVSTRIFAPLPRWHIQGTEGTATVENFNCDGEKVILVDPSVKDVIPVRTAAGITKTMAPRTDDSVRREPLPQIDPDFDAYYKNIVGVLKGEEKPIVTHAHLFRSMALMEAIFKSARENIIVDFE